MIHGTVETGIEETQELPPEPDEVNSPTAPAARRFRNFILHPARLREEGPPDAGKWDIVISRRALKSFRELRTGDAAIASIVEATFRYVLADPLRHKSHRLTAR